MRATGRLLVAVAAVLALAGCTQVPTPAPTVTPTVIADKTSPPEPVVPVVWPLTGVEGDVRVRPAVAVKIENTAAARPQTGLEHADVVWENIVEFGVSRFVAVYHSNLPAEIGPIRSIRPVDAKIASPLRGLLAFSGGQSGIVDYLKGTPLQLLSEDAGSSGFYRVSRRPAPHNVYGSLETFLRQADGAHSGSPAPEFAFASREGRASAELSGTDASAIRLSLAPGVAPRWSWDAGSGRWLRSEASGAALSSSGARLSAVNVVVLEVVSYDSGYDAQLGEPVPDMRLEGTGDGLLATGGKTIPVTWSKETRNSPVVLTTADGETATLAAGNVWVELVPLPDGSYAVE